MNTFILILASRRSLNCFWRCVRLMYRCDVIQQISNMYKISIYTL